MASSFRRVMSESTATSYREEAKSLKSLNFTRVTRHDSSSTSMRKSVSVDGITRYRQVSSFVAHGPPFTLQAMTSTIKEKWQLFATKIGLDRLTRHIMDAFDSNSNDNPTVVIEHFDSEQGTADIAGSPTASLFLNSLGQRRDSFLYRSDSEFEPSPRSLSRNSSLASESLPDHAAFLQRAAGLSLQLPGITRHEDLIVTPFAQILQTLRQVRTNFMFLTKVSNPKARRGSSQQIPNMKLNSEEETTRMALSTLEELEWCLDQLETMQTHRSVGDLASTKFRKMLGKELSAFEATSTANNGGRVSEYILNTYLDKQQELDIPSTKSNDEQCNTCVVIPKFEPQVAADSVQIDDVRPTYNRQLSGKMLSKGNSLSGCIPECPEDVPMTGVETSHEQELMSYLDKVDDWGIDIFKIAELSNNRPLTCVTYTIMKKRNLLNTFQIPPQTLVTYLMHLEAHYHTDVPYHNNLHAADVVQSAHVLLSAPVLKPIFNDLELLAAIFACAAHDVDHPGVSNQFLVQSQDQLATLYNDESVLENHHISLAFQLLKDEGCNVFKNLNEKQWKTFRKMAIDMVLATDMSKHMGLLADLKTMVETKKVAAAYELKLENYAERIQVLQNMVHCADLSNPTKPLNIYNEWTNRVMEEFFRQGDREKKLDLAVSPMCDRPENHNQMVETVGRSQIGFINYVVYPLWETWDDLVSNAEKQLGNLETNRDWYQTRNNTNTNTAFENHPEEDEEQ